MGMFSPPQLRPAGRMLRKSQRMLNPLNAPLLPRIKEHTRRIPEVHLKPLRLGIKGLACLTLSKGTSTHTLTC